MERKNSVELQRRPLRRRPLALAPSPHTIRRHNAGPLEWARASGTGFFITHDGYPLSNFHVVAEAGNVMVRTKAGQLRAEVVRTDPANDLALLEVSSASSGSRHLSPAAR